MDEHATHVLSLTYQLSLHRSGSQDVSGGLRRVEASFAQYPSVPHVEPVLSLESPSM